ncbi:MAG: DUF188 domain-containing protein [Treponema sp.]|nr:DUF188 domain-containing protein [Treponema sp.]
MLNLKIWIDADSCPALLREFVIESAKKNNIEAVFVANAKFFDETENVRIVVCKQEKDEADNVIYEQAQKNDIVITRDIIFAKRLVEKKITVINDRGILFMKDNIEDRIMERNLSLNLSEIGFGGNKKKQYGQQELKKFKSTFDSELQKHIVAEIYSAR